MDNIMFSSWKNQLIDNRQKCLCDKATDDGINLPRYFSSNQKIKALIGIHGIIIRSAQVDIADLCRVYMEKLYEHSKTCDKCNYCKTGMQEIKEVFEDFCDADGREEDLEFIQTAASAIIKYSKCSIGKLGPTPILHACKHFKNELMLTGSGEKTVKKIKYYSKLTAPCIDACPIHINIPQYIEAIKNADFQKSIDVIRKKIPIPGVLGRVCVKFCEKKCRRQNLDAPIAIKNLKRFVANYEAEKNKKPNYKIVASEKTGKVAVIGSGPCGITCAYHLTLKGHKVTIFEKLPVAGGMIAVGIPEYRLNKNILSEEISSILQLGITIKTDSNFNKEAIFALVKNKKFDAVFIATGLPSCKKLKVKGEESKGVIFGIEFLKNIALCKTTELGKNIIVIGGGNVAIDSAITAKKINNAACVKIVCIESARDMPAFEHEIQEAVKAGIKIVNSFGVKEIKAKDNKVTGIELRRCIRVFDENNNFNPAYNSSDIKTLPADTIIVAIGQKAEERFADEKDITPDPITFQTKTESIFAGGDAVYGSKSIIEAAASGRKAAINIDRFINNLPVKQDNEDYFDKFFQSVKIYDPNEVIKADESALNKEPPKEKFSNIEAIAEAERCLRCYGVFTIAA